MASIAANIQLNTWEDVFDYLDIEKNGRLSIEQAREFIANCQEKTKSRGVDKVIKPVLKGFVDCSKEQFTQLIQSKSVFEAIPFFFLHPEDFFKRRAHIKQLELDQDQEQLEKDKACAKLKGAHRFYNAITNEMYSMFGLNGDYKYNAPAKEVFALVDRCIDAFKLSCHRCGPDVPSFRAAYNEALELIGDFPKLLEAGLNFHSDLIQCCGIIMNDSELDMQSCKNKATSFVELVCVEFVQIYHVVGTAEISSCGFKMGTPDENGWIQGWMDFVNGNLKNEYGGDVVNFLLDVDMAVIVYTEIESDDDDKYSLFDDDDDSDEY